MADAKTDGGEAPSSTTGGLSNAPSPRNEEDAPNNLQPPPGAASEVAPSKSTSRASSTRNSTPAASLEVRQPAPDADDASSAMDDVQPSLEAANGASSKTKPLSKEPEQNGEAAAASSYGTRSRGRPGRSRPNYAEDAEMDFEVPAASANGNVSDPPSRSSVAPDSGHASSVSGKKGSGPAQGNGSWGNSGSNTKDSAANPTAPSTSATAASTQSSTSQPQPDRKSVV